MFTPVDILCGRYDYGVLPLDVFPAFYPKCWCSSVGQFDCSEPWHFRAFSGQLRVLCPPGYYEVESQEGPAVCRLSFVPDEDDGHG